MKWTSEAWVLPNKTPGPPNGGEQILQMLLNPVPVILTRVPPATGPIFGVTEVMVGAAKADDAVSSSAVAIRVNNVVSFAREIACNECALARAGPPSAHNPATANEVMNRFDRSAL
jgi:hypothetical protein